MTYEVKEKKIQGEVRKAWVCEITWFLDQVAGLDERLHYIVINDLILFDDEEPATYYIRVPGGTVGSIFWMMTITLKRFLLIRIMW